MSRRLETRHGEGGYLVVIGRVEVAWGLMMKTGVVLVMALGHA